MPPVSSFFVRSRFTLQVIFQTLVYISNPWNLECELTLVTTVACMLTHSASLLFLEPVPAESSASALLPSRPSSENLPPHSRALMRAPGWYSGKAGRSCQDKRVGYSSKGWQCRREQHHYF